MSKVQDDPFRDILTDDEYTEMILWESDQITQPLAYPSLPLFASSTFIETPQDKENTRQPFIFWPAQERQVSHALYTQNLICILKARQLGITWVLCAYSLMLMLTKRDQTVLVFSQGQLEANNIIERVKFLYDNHADQARFPAITEDNKSTLSFANGSSIKSLPATKKAGRSFTASLIILDEFAFMMWPNLLLKAAKPAIDNGGQLVILSSADGNGSYFHQFCQKAQSGGNGYHFIFLPWTAHPGRGENWRNERLAESTSPSDIYQEYPESPEEAFTHASGLVYDNWSDWYDSKEVRGNDFGNVSELAEYVPGGGDIYWAVDDGYVGKLDEATGTYTGESHPRVFLLLQMRADGRLCLFWESYAIQKLSDDHIAEILALPYPLPVYAGVDRSAAELKGRINTAGIYTRNSGSSVEEQIKEMRRWIAPDKNGFRRLIVHPRCKHFRGEQVRYRRDIDDGKPIKQYDHGPDALKGLLWTLRME